MRDQSQTVAVKGLRELQSGLRKAGDGADKRLKKSLRELGKTVLTCARENAPVGPRPKRSNTPPLAGSLRVAVNANGVSIYSNAAHAYVQNSGGKVGHGAVIASARASGYMTKAVADNQSRITTELDEVLAGVERDFES